MKEKVINMIYWAVFSLIVPSSMILLLTSFKGLPVWFIVIMAFVGNTHPTHAGIDLTGIQSLQNGVKAHDFVSILEMLVFSNHPNHFRLNAGILTGIGPLFVLNFKGSKGVDNPDRVGLFGMRHLLIDK